MIVETSKKAFYAAVGAPVVAARKMSERITEISERMAEDLGKEYDLWAKEGEKVVRKVADRKVVEEFVEDVSARMDFDQIQEQVGKLREQLDEMLTNWRKSFRPAAAKKPAAQKPAAKTTAAEKPAPKTAAAKTTAASKTTAARKPAAKTTTRKPATKIAAASKTTAAKKPAAKTAAAKKPAAKTAAAAK